MSAASTVILLPKFLALELASFAGEVGAAAAIRGGYLCFIGSCFRIWPSFCISWP